MLIVQAIPDLENLSENLLIYCASTPQPPPQPDDIALAGVDVRAVDSPETA
jgi:hypothetical protein